MRSVTVQEGGYQQLLEADSSSAREPERQRVHVVREINNLMEGVNLLADSSTEAFLLTGNAFKAAKDALSNKERKDCFDCISGCKGVVNDLGAALKRFRRRIDYAKSTKEIQEAAGNIFQTLPLLSTRMKDLEEKVCESQIIISKTIKDKSVLSTWAKVALAVAAIAAAVALCCTGVGAFAVGFTVPVIAMAAVPGGVAIGAGITAAVLSSDSKEVKELKEKRDEDTSEWAQISELGEGVADLMAFHIGISMADKPALIESLDRVIAKLNNTNEKFQKNVIRG